jgi:hypothetical protein
MAVRKDAMQSIGARPRRSFAQPLKTENPARGRTAGPAPRELRAALIAVF